MAGKRYLCNGEMLTVKEMSERYNLLIITIRKYLKQGISTDDIVANHVSINEKKLTFMHDGKQYTMGRYETAEFLGISYSKLLHDLKKGLTIEEICENQESGKYHYKGKYGEISGRLSYISKYFNIKYCILRHRTERYGIEIAMDNLIIETSGATV